MLRSWYILIWWLLILGCLLHISWRRLESLILLIWLIVVLLGYLRESFCLSILSPTFINLSWSHFGFASSISRWYSVLSDCIANILCVTEWVLLIALLGTTDCLIIHVYWLCVWQLWLRSSVSCVYGIEVFLSIISFISRICS